MSTENTVTLVGNLTKDPDVLRSDGGRDRTSFSIAVNRRWQNRQTQEWEEATSFFDVVCWGPAAEHVGQSVRRGDRVVVVGRLEQNTWTTDDGERRSRVQVVADEVALSLRFAALPRSARATSSNGSTALSAPSASSNAVSPNGADDQLEPPTFDEWA